MIETLEMVLIIFALILGVGMFSVILGLATLWLWSKLHG